MKYLQLAEEYEQNVVPCENMLLQNAPQLRKAE